ncbi:Two-component sensor histidine kinase, contains HisKA and HATPase domains [Litoreibacter ascidiaceicola]|uniref:histidine kinase n=1 Tax=Litoreibacter ascidiaceicola TaxID=1486859 RepID=A0A1M5E9K4_9RHOB|nr:histidine kinase dimerization/phosphoacceptor domain -containing protein [Litoreibacter ascidiaceicola]SHF75963.1 Two-component sensor histidine kinase, contains HisKA and HATPase domains [Litoreibacter ascidiaceicola]
MKFDRLRRRFDTLAFKVVVFLSLALLPIGLIAVNQGRAVNQQAQQRLELALIAWTDLAAAEERKTIQRAFAAAEALSTVLPVIKDDPQACYDMLTNYRIKSKQFSLIGFPDETGQMNCSTSKKSFNFSDNPIFLKAKSSPQPFVDIRVAGRVSETSVIVVVHPVFEGDVFKGYVVVSIPHDGLEINSEAETELSPVEVITYNSDGVVLTSTLDLASAADRLPVDRSLKTLVGSKPVAFREFQNNKDNRIYTATPIIKDTVYALSIWDGDAAVLKAASFNRSASLFPLLMWVASLVVAYMALHSLVLRHIRRLRSQMDQFAKERTVPPETSQDSQSMAFELRAMENDFVSMAQSLLQDEAAMEEVVREKNILLKEVHHRVKNNLQLISSIMNMHMRKARSSETKAVLGRLQDRILGLATVHRNLYQTDNLNNLNAGVMLSDVVAQMLSVGVAPGTDIQINKDIEDVALYPDQAVPLSLLTSEAVTNALKYVGKPAQGRPWINIKFADNGDGTATLSVANSKGPALAGNDDVEKTGLGAKLVRSFSIQLGAEVSIQDGESDYKISATFTIADFSHEPLDY